MLCGIVGLTPLPAQEKTPPAPNKSTSPRIAVDAVRMLEEGKTQMGKNNPLYANAPAKLTAEERNSASLAARGTFRSLVKLYPQFADGWLWLGIVLTESLHYSKEHPAGESNATAAEITEGIQAFQTAYQRNPTDLISVSYYGEALMTYRKDFAAACKLWEDYAAVASTDLQRMIADVQNARACLNRAYFGKAENSLSDNEVKANYQHAEDLIEKAAKLCPNAQDVKDMQALLKQYRKTLMGK